MATAINTNSEIKVEEDKKPVKRKRFPLVIAALAALAVAGGGGYFLLSHKSATNEETVAHKDEVPPVYLPLESFTVNLQPENGDQFLQVAMSLRVSGATVSDRLKARMPEIRNCLLFLLSSKHASELITTAGKEKLGREILAALNHLLDPGAAKSAAPEAKVAAEGPDTTLAASAAPGASTDDPAAVTAPGPATPAAGPEAPATVEAKPVDTPADPSITGVLFTSFIIQ